MADHYEMPVFEPGETAFLRHYSQTLNRAEAMVTSGLALHRHIALEDEPGLEREATKVIAKAALLNLEEIANAIGADKVAFVRRIWDICLSEHAHVAVKGLQMLGRLHGLYGDGKGIGHGGVAIILGQPDKAKSVTPPGLPFRLDGETPAP